MGSSLIAPPPLLGVASYSAAFDTLDQQLILEGLSVHYNSSRQSSSVALFLSFWPPAIRHYGQHFFKKKPSTSVWCPPEVSTGSHFIHFVHSAPLKHHLKKNICLIIINMHMTKNYRKLHLHLISVRFPEKPQHMLLM